MGVYVFIAIWSVLIGAFVLQNRNRSYEKNRKSYMFLLSCVLAIIMGLRATTVGQDTLSYKNMFDTVSSIPIDMLFNISSYSSKIGYVLLMKVCSYIVNDYFFFQIVVSVLFCIGISKFLLDHGRDMLLITMVFLGCGFYLSAFNVTREAIAVVLVVNAFTAIEEQKWKQAVILFLLAISIHLTALSFLWGVVIYIFKDKEWIIKWAPIITMIVGLGYEIVIELASKFFPMYFNYYKNYTKKKKVPVKSF